MAKKCAVALVFSMLLCLFTGCDNGPQSAVFHDFPEFNANNAASGVAWKGDKTLYVGFIPKGETGYQLWEVEPLSKTNRHLTTFGDGDMQFFDGLQVLKNGTICVKAMTYIDTQLYTFFFYDPVGGRVESVEIGVAENLSFEGYVDHGGENILYTLAGNDGNNVYIYNIKTGAETLAAQDELLLCVSKTAGFYATGFQVPGSKYEGTEISHAGIRLREIGGDEIHYEFSSAEYTADYVARPIFSDGGKLFFSYRSIAVGSGEDVHYRVYDMKTSAEGAHNVSFDSYGSLSRDGGFFVKGVAVDGKLEIVDTATGNARELIVDTDYIMDTALSPNDKQVALICKRNQKEAIAVASLR